MHKLDTQSVPVKGFLDFTLTMLRLCELLLLANLFKATVLSQEGISDVKQLLWNSLKECADYVRCQGVIHLLYSMYILSLSMHKIMFIDLTDQLLIEYIMKPVNDQTSSLQASENWNLEDND